MSASVRTICGSGARACEVEGDADVVPLLDEGLAVRGQHHRGSTARPEVGAVEAEGKEVVAHAVAAPLLAAAGVRDVPERSYD